MAVRKGSTPGCPLPCRGCHRAGLPPPGGSRGPFLHLVATNPFSHLGSYPIAFSPPSRSSPFRPEGLAREVPLPGKDSLLCRDPRPAPPALL